MMKSFSIITLLLQLALIAWAKYYGYMMDMALTKLSSVSESEVLKDLVMIKHYQDLDSYLGLATGVVWILFILVAIFKKVLNTKEAQLTIYVPMIASLVVGMF
ncbi:hypothetical protein [Vibrio sp. H11]|uniref:hypothetical protein n=1 Tax=Vibrio sp. H11 TaxID=2565928 RepID=UPI0010A64831|nr:hypothetical protein [Vibrio sp. H11]